MIETKKEESNYIIVPKIIYYNLFISYYVSNPRPLELEIALDKARDNAYELFRALDLSHIHEFSLPFDHDSTDSFEIDHDSTDNFEIVLALSIALDLARTFVNPRNTDHYYIQYINKAIQYCINKSRKQKKLYNNLKKLKIPIEKTFLEEWQNFSSNLRKIFDTHFGIENYFYTLNEINNINTYLKLNLLCLNCLNIASVSNREKYKEQLFTFSE